MDPCAWASILTRASCRNGDLTTTRTVCESSLFASSRRSAVASLPSSLRQRFSKGTALEASLYSRKSSPPAARSARCASWMPSAATSARRWTVMPRHSCPILRHWRATPSRSRHTWALAHYLLHSNWHDRPAGECSSWRSRPTPREPPFSTPAAKTEPALQAVSCPNWRTLTASVTNNTLALLASSWAPPLATQ